MDRFAVAGRAQHNGQVKWIGIIDVALNGSNPAIRQKTVPIC